MKQRISRPKNNFTRGNKKKFNIISSIIASKSDNFAIAKLEER